MRRCMERRPLQRAQLGQAAQIHVSLSDPKPVEELKSPGMLRCIRPASDPCRILGNAARNAGNAGHVVLRLRV